MMRDGQIEGDHAWFRFSLQELEWLRDLIPSTDKFRQQIAETIRELKQRQQGVSDAGND